MIPATLRRALLLALPAVVLLTASVPPVVDRAVAQGTAGRTFPETGHAVSGRFLEYWDAHGGLAQQGYPISEEMQEKSDIDGKVYTVQYFERAVFEKHPENPLPNDVLLSLLGVLRYRHNYTGSAGAPHQQPNTAEGSVLFEATGKRLGGTFLEYWQTHGSLAQQGYPISDEFVERSPIDKKEYLVQYFERAVFELHPENMGTPYEVLLSQLGTVRYEAAYNPDGTPRHLMPADTSMFRGDPRHTGFYDTAGVSSFTEVKWKFKAGGSVRASPAVAGATVYFGSNDGNLYAVDVQTGQRRWAFKTDYWVESSPAVSGGLVYFGSHDGTLHALDARTGQEKWTFKTGGSVSSSPVVADGLVYAGSLDHTLYAVDAVTGQLRWKFTTADIISSSPAVDADRVYFGGEDQYMYALDKATGQLRWKVKVGDVIFSSPAVADGVVYFGSEDHNLYAVDAGTGSYRWVFKTEGMIYSSPAVAGGKVYVGSDDGHLYAVDAATGRKVWDYDTHAWVYSSPAVADGVVYFGSEDYSLHALDASTGEEKWSYKTGHWVDCSPAVADGVVYVGSDDSYLYAIR